VTEKILVTYASRFGATAGVAEAIGKTLAELGAQVDVLPMKNVTDLSPYQAVVAGSAINGGAWLPEAMQFLQAHQAELRRKPFAAFLVCMTLTMKNGEQYRSHVSTWLEPVRALARPDVDHPAFGLTVARDQHIGNFWFWVLRIIARMRLSDSSIFTRIPLDLTCR